MHIGIGVASHRRHDLFGLGRDVLVQQDVRGLERAKPDTRVGILRGNRSNVVGELVHTLQRPERVKLGQGRNLGRFALGDELLEERD